MVLGKVVKNKAYYKRYQVKYRRRREGKTDYRARLRLCTQDKNKYMTPKYRFVVRFTNKDIICQIAYATIAGDKIVASAYSHELPNYGLSVGLTNYPAAYCTGLLLARRVLTQFKLDETFVGVEEPDGELNEIENDEETDRRPFKAILDAGLKKTTTGSKIFGALKGGLDGGLNIPHNEKRFPGFIDKKYDAEMHKGYIFGSHVAEYMGTMEEEEPEKYQSHFKNYIDEGVEGDDLEDLYAEVHEKIRKNPMREKKERKKPDEPKRWLPVKLTYDERKQRLLERIQAIRDADEE